MTLTTPPLTDVIAVASGGAHLLALTRGGQVIAWGDNSYGQIDVPSGLAGVVAIAAAATHSVALKADGTVVAWGSNLNGQANVPQGLDGVIAIDAGGETSVGLRRDGTAVYWGMYASGSYKTIGAAGFSIISVGVGDTHLAAVFNDGDLGGHSIDLASAYKPKSPPVPLPFLIAVTVGSGFLVGLTREGTVVSWGRNDYGQATPPEGLAEVSAVSAGGASALALLTNGTVVGWGTASVPPDLSEIAAVSAGKQSIALKRDGTVVVWGSDD